MSAKHQPIEAQIAELRRELLDHDCRYYMCNQPMVSDAEYDALLRRLKELEAERPDLVTPDQARVGAGGRGLRPVHAQASDDVAG